MANLTYRGSTTTPTIPGSTTAQNSPLDNDQVDGNFRSLEAGKLDNTGGIITGDLTVTGTVTAADVNSTSDARVKTDLEEITSALDKIKTLTGYTFTMTTTGLRSAGLIAQDVEKILPEVVHHDEEDNLSLAYGNMMGLIVEAIKELNDKIESLK